MKTNLQHSRASSAIKCKTRGMFAEADFKVWRELCNQTLPTPSFVSVLLLLNRPCIVCLCVCVCFPASFLPRPPVSVPSGGRYLAPAMPANMHTRHFNHLLLFSCLLACLPVHAYVHLPICQSPDGYLCSYLSVIVSTYPLTF